MLSKNYFLSFIIVALSCSAVVQAQAEEESFALAVDSNDDKCSTYDNVTYTSDNRNPKPKFILEPIPSVPRVFLRRMRKAGSTSVETFVQRARQLHQKFQNSPKQKKEKEALLQQQEEEGGLVVAKTQDQDGDFSFIGYDAMEYESLNVHCVFGLLAPLRQSNHAILVTHFRNPLIRLNSEYWSDGPGKKVADATDETWKGWMAMTPKRLAANVGVSFEPGLYVDNYYVRQLTGNCGDCHLRTVKKRNKNDLGMAQGCKATSDYYSYPVIDFKQYCQAMKTLKQFGIILILEYYDKPSMSAYLRHKFEKLIHLPKGSLDGLGLGHERNNNIIPEEHHEHRMSPPPSMIEMLEEDNKYDMQLYNWAKNHVDELIAPYAHLDRGTDEL